MLQVKKDQYEYLDDNDDNNNDGYFMISVSFILSKKQKHNRNMIEMQREQLIHASKAFLKLDSFIVD